MSKYIKLEDVIRKYAEMIADEAYWEHGVGNGKPDEEDLDIAREYYSDLPTIEVSEDCISREDFLKTIDDNVSQQYSDTYETYGLDLWALFVRMVKNAPSVVPQVPNEDCISREYLEEQLQQIEDITAMAHIDLGENPYDETEEITMPISTVRKIFKKAPSVVPQVPNEDCISRSALISFIDAGHLRNPNEKCYSENDVVELIRNAPSVVPSIAEGEWVDCDSDNNIYDDIRCSICGKRFTVDAYRKDDIGFTITDLNYCPNCGAKMIGKELICQ